MTRHLAIFMALVSLFANWIVAAPTSAPATRPMVESEAIIQGGVAVQVCVERGKIPADSQPRFEVRFTNRAADYVNLYDVNAFWDWSFEFTITDPQAPQPGPWKVRFNTILFRYPLDHKQIKPGESLAVTIDLNNPPFTFDYVYAGPVDRTIQPIRSLHPGTYQLSATVALKNPFGPGYHEWTGPVVTHGVAVSIPPPAAKPPPTEKELAAYDAAIDRVISKLAPHGLWQNGGFPEINLPASAPAEDVIAAAVNAYSRESKAYRILRIHGPDHANEDRSAALVIVGGKARVLVFMPLTKERRWTRFYDSDYTPAATQP